MKQRLIKYLCYLVVGNLNNIETSRDEREAAYEMLYANQKMMKVLGQILIADTKEMMKRDAMKGDFERGIRYGAFMRTQALISKAKEHYENVAAEEGE